MPCFHWSIFGPFSWTILGPCWCLSLISWLSRYHRYLNHRVLDILQDQANSKRSVGLLSLSLSLCLFVSHTNRCNTMAAKHADPWWFALKRPATRLHVLKQAASYRVRPFQNPSSTTSHVKPRQAAGESHQVRNGPAYRRLAAEVMCQICAGNSWIRRKLSGIALVGRNKIQLDSRASFPVLIPDEEWRLEKASQLRKWKSQRNLSLPFFTNCPPHIVQEVTRHLFCKGRCVAAICKFGGTDIYRKIEISKVQKGNVAFRCIWDLGETIWVCWIGFWYWHPLTIDSMSLPRCFPENECLCSTTFEAAGVGILGYLLQRQGDTLVSKC